MCVCVVDLVYIISSCVYLESAQCNSIVENRSNSLLSKQITCYNIFRTDNSLQSLTRAEPSSSPTSSQSATKLLIACHCSNLELFYPITCSWRIVVPFLWHIIWTAFNCSISVRRFWRIVLCPECVSLVRNGNRIRGTYIWWRLSMWQANFRSRTRSVSLALFVCVCVVAAAFFADLPYAVFGDCNYILHEMRDIHFAHSLCYCVGCKHKQPRHCNEMCCLYNRRLPRALFGPALLARTYTPHYHSLPFPYALLHSNTLTQPLLTHLSKWTWSESNPSEWAKSNIYLAYDWRQMVRTNKRSSLLALANTKQLKLHRNRKSQVQ